MLYSAPTRKLAAAESGLIAPDKRDWTPSWTENPIAAAMNRVTNPSVAESNSLRVIQRVPKPDVRQAEQYGRSLDEREPG